MFGLIALCLCGGVVVAVVNSSPRLGFGTDSVWVCGGANLRGRFRIGFGWASNLVGIAHVQIALSHTLCGYLPRPLFLSPYGTLIFHR